MNTNTNFGNYFVQKWLDLSVKQKAVIAQLMEMNIAQIDKIVNQYLLK